MGGQHLVHGKRRRLLESHARCAAHGRHRPRDGDNHRRRDPQRTRQQHRGAERGRERVQGSPGGLEHLEQLDGNRLVGHRRLHRAHVAADQRGDVPAADLDALDEFDVGRFAHGVRRLD